MFGDWEHVPPPPVRRGNQGQIPAVYSRSLCQLLRKSERTPPAGCQREVDVMSVGMSLRGQRRERAEFSKPPAHVE